MTGCTLAGSSYSAFATIQTTAGRSATRIGAKAVRRACKEIRQTSGCCVTFAVASQHSFESLFGAELSEYNNMYVSNDGLDMVQGCRVFQLKNGV